MTPIEPTEEVECVICHDDMPIDEAHEIMDKTYVCDPDHYPECYAEWNDREYTLVDWLFRPRYVRSEFYD